MMLDWVRGRRGLALYKEQLGECVVEGKCDAAGSLHHAREAWCQKLIDKHGATGALTGYLCTALTASVIAFPWVLPRYLFFRDLERAFSPF